MEPQGDPPWAGEFAQPCRDPNSRPGLKVSRSGLEDLTEGEAFRMEVVNLDSCEERLPGVAGMCRDKGRALEFWGGDRRSVLEWGAFNTRVGDLASCGGGQSRPGELACPWSRT